MSLEPLLNVIYNENLEQTRKIYFVSTFSLKHFTFLWGPVVMNSVKYF